MIGKSRVNEGVSTYTQTLLGILIQNTLCFLMRNKVNIFFTHNGINQYFRIMTKYAKGVLSLDTDKQTELLTVPAIPWHSQ